MAFTVRRGLIRGPGFHAKLATSPYRGRIQVDRGSGMIEYPAPSQFGRIAREEGISKADAERAFGHMRPLKTNAGGATVIRRGLIQTPGLRAEAYRGADALRAGRIVVVEGDEPFEKFVTPTQFAPIARRHGIDASAVLEAFGDLFQTETHQATVHRYGPKKIKLGHYDEKRGEPVGGLRAGQLVMFDATSGEILFALFEDKGGKLKTEQARLISLASAFKKAAAIGIPKHAFVDAFGHMMHPEARRQLLAKLHTKQTR